MKKRVIVIASPHHRNDSLHRRLSERLPNYQVERIWQREELSVHALEHLRPEFVFFPHWSWLIPKEIHSKFECVVFHMTDVPFGRGGSPLQNLIVRGYEETKLTALRCVAKMDAGDVYMKRLLRLHGTAEKILGEASALIEEMIVEIVKSRPTPVPQRGEVVEFKRRRPEDGDMINLATLREVYNYIRMLDADGYARAFLDTKHLHFEFEDANIAGSFVEAKVRIKRKNCE